MNGSFLNTYTLDITPSEDGNVFISGAGDVNSVFPDHTPIAEIITWADGRPAFTLKQRMSHREPALAIRFDNISGLLYLRTANGTEIKYDPLSDEAIARLVRKVKSFAPIPHETPSNKQRTLPGLPEPTDADLARRTIYTNIGIPVGVSGYRPHKPRPRYQQSTASKARSQEIAAAIVAELFG